MSYEKESIEDLKIICATLYEEETYIHGERRKATKVLRLKLKQREAGELVEEAQAVLAELSEPSFFDRLKEKVGL